MFFEDQSVIKGFRNSLRCTRITSGLVPAVFRNAAVYHMDYSLEAAGLGASLQHYNPLIDDEVKKAWNLPDE